MALPDGLEVCENSAVVAEHGIVGAPLDDGRTGELGKGEDLEALRVHRGQAPVPGPAVHLHFATSTLPFVFCEKKSLLT